MTEPQIGWWIKREGPFRRHIDDNGNERWTGPRWHHVDSIVAGDVVPKCGRRMPDSKPFEVRDVMPLTRLIGQPQLCRAGCDRPGMVVRNNEDDGSTAPTDDTP